MLRKSASISRRVSGSQRIRFSTAYSVEFTNERSHLFVDMRNNMGKKKLKCHRQSMVLTHIDNEITQPERTFLEETTWLNCM